MVQCRHHTLFRSIAGLALFGASVAIANDSAIENVGGTIKAMREHPSVSLVAEYVHVWLGSDSVEVECIFYLKNSGDSTLVQMGFPEMAAGVDVRAPSRFPDFTSWVDGTEVKTVAVSQPSDIPEGEHWTWWVKEVPFEAGATRVVRDRYVAAPGADATGGLLFRYVLDTGASWAGRIGVADIVVTVPVAFELDEGYIIPKGWIRSNGEIRWHLQDFEPRFPGDNTIINLRWKITSTAEEPVK